MSYPGTDRNQALQDTLTDQDTFDVWTWKRGSSWRRVLEGAQLDETTRALVELAPCSSGAAFAAELQTNPNRCTGDDIVDLAALTVGPIADLTGRRHHA